MTDKQRLAVLVHLANSLCEYSRIMKPEQYQEVEIFQKVVFNALNSFFKCDLEENKEMIQDEMEVTAVEYMFEEMKYFTEKYGKEEN
ncbi:hypothetical protein [Kurthia gibsonii]|uniref:hypothetical protein n=1 Tax=Kurthia gibsonii TaxID=33946 RepID=UPI003017F4BE